MNKIASVTALVFFFALVFIGSSVFAQVTFPTSDLSAPPLGVTFETAAYEGQAAAFPTSDLSAPAMGVSFEPMNYWWTAQGLYGFEGSWLIGHRVYSLNGTYYLGQIDSFVVDETNGRIPLAVLSDIPTFGTKKVAIPFTYLKRDVSGNFVLAFPPYSQVSDHTADSGFLPTAYLTQMESCVLPSNFDSDWVASVYMQMDVAPYWTVEQEHPVMTLYDSRRLMGAEVQLAQGGSGGRINDFVIDFSDGHIAFLVLFDVPGRGDALVAVPFGSLSSSGENAFVLNVTSDRLASAPAFDEFRDIGNRTYVADVYRQFGVQPYWTEEEMH